MLFFYDISFVTPSRTTNFSSVDDNLFGITPRSSALVKGGTSIQSSNVTPVRRIKNSRTISEEMEFVFTLEHVLNGDTTNEEGGTSCTATNEEVVAPQP